MRQDVSNEIEQLKRKDLKLLNKSELARRMGCNRRTIDKYIKQATGQLNNTSRRKYESLLDPYKSIIIDKVETYGASAMAVYKFIQKKGFSGKYGIVNQFVKKQSQNRRKQLYDLKQHQACKHRLIGKKA